MCTACRLEETGDAAGLLATRSSSGRAPALAIVGVNSDGALASAPAQPAEVFVDGFTVPEVCWTSDRSLRGLVLPNVILMSVMTLFQPAHPSKPGKLSDFWSCLRDAVCM